jgi:DNA-binding NtrC family response regulator
MNLIINLLVLSEDSALCDMIKKSSLPRKCVIYFYSVEQDLYSLLEYNDIHVAIADFDQKKSKGLDLLKRIKQYDPLVDVIMTGQNITAEEALDFINHGANDSLSKPIQEEVFITTLNKIINKKILRKETFLLEKRLGEKYSFHGLISKSPNMFEIFSLIENVAKYFSSVLITGETGTGKEMVAQALHQLSQQEKKDLVICDCVSIPENLFESELFGYVKGAFTGADKDKKGLFEEADGGIIFLDEIGEIPLSVQAKLLRVLEQHQFRPLGSSQNKKIDVRVIAATSRDLRESIKKGTFREDLFHRLNKVEIHLPPLRERSEDIPLLVRHFLNRYRKKLSKELRGVTRQVQKLFLRYNWPGNIRELENVLERASILTMKKFIDFADLPKYLQDALPAAKILPLIKKDALSTLEELEKEYISYLLKLTKHNIKQTSKILKISRTTLYSKLNKYNIPRKPINLNSS